MINNGMKQARMNVHTSKLYVHKHISMNEIDLLGNLVSAEKN